MSPSTFGHNGFTGTSLWMDPVHQCYVIVLTNAVHPEAHRPEADLILQVFIPATSAYLVLFYILTQIFFFFGERKKQLHHLFFFFLCAPSPPSQLCRSDPRLQRRSCDTSRSPPARWTPGASPGSARLGLD